MFEIEIMKIYENIVGKGLNEKIKAVPLWIYLGIVFFLRKKLHNINSQYDIGHIIILILMFEKYEKALELLWVSVFISNTNGPIGIEEIFLDHHHRYQRLVTLQRLGFQLLTLR